MQLSLADRTVLVTGGGSGIGKGVASAVVAAGGNAMLVGRNADRLAAAADEIKAAGGAGSVLYEPADVTSEDEVARIVDAATAGPAGCTASCIAQVAAKRSDPSRRSTPTPGGARST